MEAERGPPPREANRARVLQAKYEAALERLRAANQTCADLEVVVAGLRRSNAELSEELGSAAGRRAEELQRALRDAEGLRARVSELSKQLSLRDAELLEVRARCARLEREAGEARRGQEEMELLRARCAQAEAQARRLTAASRSFVGKELVLTSLDGLEALGEECVSRWELPRWRESLATVREVIRNAGG